MDAIIIRSARDFAMDTECAEVNAALHLFLAEQKKIGEDARRRGVYGRAANAFLEAAETAQRLGDEDARAELWDAFEEAAEYAADRGEVWDDAAESAIRALERDDERDFD